MNKNFTIVIDTKEKYPWGFSDKVETQRTKLSSGDYSLLGYENQIAIERKALEDLVNTVVHHKDRFRAELSKLRQFRYSWIVVEGSVEDILRGNYQSKMPPKALLGIITSIMTDYIPIVFGGDRACSIIIAEDLLYRAYCRIKSNKQ